MLFVHCDILEKLSNVTTTLVQFKMSKHLETVSFGIHVELIVNVMPEFCGILCVLMSSSPPHQQCVVGWRN